MSEPPASRNSAIQESARPASCHSGLQAGIPVSQRGSWMPAFAGAGEGADRALSGRESAYVK
jgi:hypothetical protein